MKFIVTIIIIILFLLEIIALGQNNIVFSVFDWSSEVQYTDSWSVNWVDFNNDGWDDLFIPTYNIDQENTMYQNNGGKYFTKLKNVNPVIDKCNATASSWADFDNNGLPDLLISENIRSGNNLYRSDCNGNFKKLQDISITEIGELSHGAAWADVNLDGYIDAFVSNYEKDQPDRLFINIGGKKFESIEFHKSGQSIGAAWADVNNDSYPDLFVPSNGGANVLYINNKNLTFTAVSFEDSAHSVGCSFGDIDNDDDLDLFVANASKEDNFLYKNNGIGKFYLDESSIVSNQGGDSHGSCFGDYNNDGWLDLLVTNDRGGNKFFYLNKGDGSFVRELENIIVEESSNAFGVAASDFDKDGDLDIFISNHSNEKNYFYKNETTNTNWLNIKLRGNESNKSAIGAKIRIKTTIDEKPTWLLREVSSQTSGGPGSQNSMIAHFGLGKNKTIDSLVVEWPSKLIQVFSNISSNENYQISEGQNSLFASINTKYKECVDVGETCHLNIFPNPSDGCFDFTVITQNTKPSKQNKVSVFNISGKLLLKYNNIDLTKINNLNIANYPEGVYVLKIEFDDKVIFEKLVKRD